MLCKGMLQKTCGYPEVWALCLCMKATFFCERTRPDFSSGNNSFTCGYTLRCKSPSHRNGDPPDPDQMKREHTSLKCDMSMIPPSHPFRTLTMQKPQVLQWYPRLGLQTLHSMQYFSLSLCPSNVFTGLVLKFMRIMYDLRH